MAAKKADIPGKKGDKVICHIGGKSVPGIICNDDISGGQLIGVLLDKKVVGEYLNGYGATIGYQNLKNKKMIQKTGEATKEELQKMEERIKEICKPSWKK